MTDVASVVSSDSTNPEITLTVRSSKVLNENSILMVPASNNVVASVVSSENTITPTVRYEANESNILIMVPASSNICCPLVKPIPPILGLPNPGLNLCALNSMVQLLRASEDVLSFTRQDILATTGSNDRDGFCGELINLITGRKKLLFEDQSCADLSMIIQNKNLVLDGEQCLAMIQRGKARVYDVNEQFSLAIRRLILLHKEQPEKLDLVDLESLLKFTLKEIKHCSNCNNEFINFSDRLLDTSFKLICQGNKKIKFEKISEWKDYWSSSMPVG